jgi:transforming growth factor-beta-induced protein
MMNRVRTIKLMAACASLSLVAAACGSDSNDAATTEAPAASAAPAGTDAPATSDAATDGPFGPACSAVPADGEGSFAGMTDDTAATAASNNPLLSTLVTAVTEAGLVDTLNSDGPFTIFAPVNDAFAAIPEEDLAAVLADKELLTSILTYHVIAGESLDAAALGEAGSAVTVNGGTLEFGADGTTVNGVDVLCSNVVTANATVHIIGEVLMPTAEEAPVSTDAEGVMMPTGPLCSAVPADGEGSFAGMTDDTAATAASNNPVLSTLVAAVTEAGLVDTLNSDGPFTIFAPANPAFEALGDDAVAALLADKDALTSVLTLHVVAGEKLSSADLAELDSVTTVNGADISIDVADDGSLMINGQATVGCADIQTANATVHVIDAVLMP